MHLLAAINNNVEEWRALQHFDQDKPRLPLPYAFGGAFLKVGHTLSAIDLCSTADKKQISPFKSLYYKNEFGSALKGVDVAALWGSDALKALLKQSLTPASRKNILYFTYVIAPENPSGRQRINDMAIQVLARSAKGIVLMTAEQEAAAHKLFAGSLPVIRLRCGIDTAFYRGEASLSDVPEKHRSTVEALLAEPYVIMPGDELRYNDDAIHFVENTGIRLVRVSQYGAKSNTEKLKRDITERKLGDRLVVFENISYAFLRFLFQHGSAYAGLVDSSWQPAGWTVACEALSSGLPMVLYEGLVSRELADINSPLGLVKAVPMSDVNVFSETLAEMVQSNQSGGFTSQAATFASENLDFQKTSSAFVKQVVALVGKL
jgi:hypothetical protein